MAFLRTLCALLLLSAVIFAGATPCMGQSSSAAYAEKIAVERHLEERLDRAIKKIAGIEDLVVVVNAVIETVKGEKQLPADADGASAPTGRPLLLPGVPVREELRPGAQGTVPVTTPSFVALKRLNITLLMDSAIQDDIAGVVHDVAISVVGFNPDRGDRIDIRRVDFLNKNVWGSMLTPRSIVTFLLALTAMAFFITAAFFFMNPLRFLPSAMKGLGIEGGQGRAMENNRPAPVPTQRPEMQSSQRPKDETGRFGFITSANVSEAGFLLMDAPAGDIATVLNFMEPELAVELTSAFPIDLASEALSLLSSTRETEGSKVDELERSLKQRLSYVMGGSGRLASILNLADDEMRERAIEAVERKDWGESVRLREKVRSFESVIRGMEPKDIQALARGIHPRVFARILNSTPGDVQAKVFDSLSSGATERITEEMKYAGTFPPERLKLEKLAIVNRYLDLLDSGEIQGGMGT